ncbi:MAG: DUF3450 domain-containing protein [Desulfurivibrio sp.]|nr:DUF3450 domain-containing protein [Desulfurivibrio sp.]
MLLIPCITAGFILTFFLACNVLARAEAQDTGEQVRKPVQEAVEIRQKTQKEREEWQEERQELVACYDRLLEENKDLKDQHGGLYEQVETAKARVSRKEKQLRDIEQVAEDIEPFLEQRLDSLEQLVAKDLPFLPAEREKRRQRLEELMRDPEQKVSEKYRRIMEAFLVEAEYGRTIEVRQKSIQVEGRNIRADIFRLGRLGLFYQTRDNQECGWYNVAQKKWQELPGKYNWAIGKAIDVGAERQPAELLTMPLGRLEVE